MRSFYLAVGDNGFIDRYDTQREAVSLPGAHESAKRVFICIPDHRGGFTADDVTEKLAALWWRDDVDARDMRGGFTPADIKTIPLAYRPVLAGKLNDLMNAQRRAVMALFDRAIAAAPDDEVA